MKNRINKLQGVLFEIVNGCYLLTIELTKEFTDKLGFVELHRELKSASKMNLKKVADFLNIPSDRNVKDLRFYINLEMGERCWNFPMNDEEPYYIKIYNLYYEVLKILGVNKIKISI